MQLLNGPDRFGMYYALVTTKTKHMLYMTVLPPWGPASEPTYIEGDLWVLTVSGNAVGDGEVRHECNTRHDLANVIMAYLDM
jgi:hypothetical protein